MYLKKVNSVDTNKRNCPLGNDFVKFLAMSFLLTCLILLKDKEIVLLMCNKGQTEATRKM